MLLQGVETLPFGSRRVLIAFRIGIGSWCGNWRGGCETWRQICYTKMLGGKLEFLPFFSCWNFLHSPKKSFLVVHCSSHNFTFCRQKLGDHQGRRSATPAQMVCSFWAIAWIPKSPLVDLAIPPWMPGSTARVTRCFSGRWGGSFHQWRHWAKPLLPGRAATSLWWSKNLFVENASQQVTSVAARHLRCMWYMLWKRRMSVYVCLRTVQWLRWYKWLFKELETVHSPTSTTFMIEGIWYD